MRVSGLDLTVRKGEIVGLFGLLGAGCIEAALADLRRLAGRREGTILVDGAEADDRQPRRAVALGFGLMAQDRRDCLIGDQSIADNIGIASLDKRAAQRRPRSGRMAAAGARPGRPPADQGRVDRRRGADALGRQPAEGADRPLARRRHAHPDHDRPDARRRCRRAARDQGDLVRAGGEGQAILLASTDVEELVDVCDRVIVMSHGRRVGELTGGELTERNLLRMAADG